VVEPVLATSANNCEKWL